MPRLRRYGNEIKSESSSSHHFTESSSLTFKSEPDLQWRLYTLICPVSSPISHFGLRITLKQTYSCSSSSSPSPPSVSLFIFVKGCGRSVRRSSLRESISTRPVWFIRFYSRDYRRILRNGRVSLLNRARMTSIWTRNLESPVRKSKGGRGRRRGRTCCTAEMSRNWLCCILLHRLLVWFRGRLNGSMMNLWSVRNQRS